MRVRFWGTRGSIATPGPSTVRYGGNTSCVEVRSARGTCVVLDCGTGARPLGSQIVEAAHGEADDRCATARPHPLGPHPRPAVLRPALRPWPMGRLRPARHERVAAPDARRPRCAIRTSPSRSISSAAGSTTTSSSRACSTSTTWWCARSTSTTRRSRSRIAWSATAATVCYVADHEPFDPALGAGGDVRSNRDDDRHVAFLEGADVVIHDAQYTPEEYAGRVGWGHSTIEYAVDVCCAAGAAQTVLFHHDPSHDDDTVDRLLLDAQRRAGARTTVSAAPKAAPSTSPGPAWRWLHLPRRAPRHVLLSTRSAPTPDPDQRRAPALRL